MHVSLTPEQFAQIADLFHRAAGLPAEARAAFVAELRVGSPAVADHLSRMLEADAGDSSFVEGIIADSARDAVGLDEALIGERFGPYRLERIIGYGGMGAVFLGSRADDEFRQVVAIKTIRAGRESPGGLERFRREREILARLDHPGIARLVDGGTGPRGVPFVAMEYIEGVPLMTHLAERRTPLRARLQLFLELCDAVEVVHRSLIVHRDIKPGNVMVTPDGRVKLLDFGIAKLVDEFDPAPAVTVTAQRAMTPEYASPEQILGRPVTMATDVYGLGVLLYEMLTGARPVAWDSSHPYELAQAIVQETPTAPSDAVRRAGEASGRPEPSRRLVRLLRGDLDRVVLTAMRKEPERRYPSVAALASDVRAWLAGRPVTAQPDTRRYRVRKFVGRHPVATAVAGAFLATVAAFTAVTVRQARLIARERDTAVVAERRAGANADFLARLFTTADPRTAGNRNMTAFELLHAGVAQLAQDHSLDPRVRADLYLTLGRALVDLEEFDEGVAAVRRSVEETERSYGHDSLETAEHLNRLGDVLREANRTDEAYAALTEALAIRRGHIQGDAYEIADSYNNLSLVAIVLGKYRESADLVSASIAMHRRLTGDASEPIAVPLNNLALLERRQGRLQDALDLATRAHAILQTTDDQNSTLWALGNVAGIRRDMGQVRETEPVFREVLDRYRTLLGPTHTRVLGKERDLVVTRYLLGDYAAALRDCVDLEQRTRAAMGEQSQDLAQVLRLHGQIARDLGDGAQAERLMRTALADHLAATGPRHFRIPSFRRTLAEILIDRGAWSEAEEQLRTTLALLPDSATLPHVERARALIALSRLLIHTRRTAEAEAALSEAHSIITATTGAASVDMGRWLLRHGQLEGIRDEPAKARAAFDGAAGILASRLPARSHDRVELEAELASGRSAPVGRPR